MKDVADTPTGNVIQFVRYRVAGMTITTDGTPGGLQHRNINTWSFIIRGMPTDRCM